jgi:small subunit ribosomal protein S20
MFSAAPPGGGHVVAGCVWGGCANRNILTGQVEFINKTDSSKKQKGVISLANHKSAIKRARQSEDRRLRNRMTKTQVKNVVKSVRLAADEKSPETAATLKQAQSIIDKAAKKGTLHKRTAARKISRLSKLVKAQGS